MSLEVLDIECIENKIVKELGVFKNGQTVGYFFLMCQFFVIVLILVCAIVRITLSTTCEETTVWVAIL